MLDVARWGIDGRFDNDVFSSVHVLDGLRSSHTFDQVDHLDRSGLVVTGEALPTHRQIQRVFSFNRADILHHPAEENLSPMKIRRLRENVFDWEHIFGDRHPLRQQDERYRQDDRSSQRHDSAHFVPLLRAKKGDEMERDAGTIVTTFAET